jgi:amino acid adenylation domain-containing protein/non-ribosomal peptide synthase protein (TIGR01720 family)
LLLVIHHLAVDGVSWRILLEELERAYEQATRGEPIALAAASTPWSVWAAQLADYARRPDIAQELAFWEQALAGATNALPLDGDGDRSLAASRQHGLRLDAGATQRLLQAAARAYRLRVDELLLAALARAVRVWSGQSGVLVELEGHGREDVIPGVDLSRTVGWFTTRYPLWLEARDDCREALVSMKERLRTLPEKGLHWGFLRHAPATSRRASELPVPRVSFNYLGRFDQTLPSGGRFGFAEEAAGESVSPASELGYVLDVNGLIADGGLSVSFRYSPGVLSAATVDRLTAAFEIELATLVEHCQSAPPLTTASDFPLSGLAQAQFEALALPLAQIQDIYPATPLQQGLLFHALAHSEQGVYINQLRLTLRGELDRPTLRAAWQAAVQRHDILRTRFEWRHGGSALQIVYRELELPYRELDWRSVVDYEARFSDWCAEDLRRGFALDRAPLLRVTLFSRPDGAYDLVRTSHHVLSDGWSAEQLFSEIMQGYITRRHGEAPELEPPVPYRDYVAWLARQPSAEAWWRARLAEVEDPAGLFDGLPPRIAGEPGAGSLERWLDAALAERVRRRAQERQVTLSTLFQAAWALVLSRYSHRREVAFGLTVSGRPADLPGAERIVGPFINSLPVWLRVDGDSTPEAFLKQVHRHGRELSQYEHTPLHDLQRWSGRSGDALFDTLLVFENYPVDDELLDEADVGLVLEHSELVDRAHYPLVLTVVPGEQIKLEWEWNGARLERFVVEQLSGHYVEALAALAGRAERLAAIELSAPASSVSAPAPAFRPISARIAEHAARRPAASAVRAGSERLSHAQLEAWSNHIARRLRQVGVAAEERVGLCVERSGALVAALLGILKSGGAYVPLDPEYPLARLQQIVQSSGMRRVVVDASSSERLSALLASLELVSVAERADESPEVMPLELQPELLAYVIYTSGSTGEPKGVAVSQGALSRHVREFSREYALSEHDRVLQFSTINFDSATEQLLPVLAAGGEVVMRGPGLPEWDEFNSLLLECGVTVMDLPTAYFQQWLQHLPPRLPQLRVVTASGEALPPDAVRRWRASQLGAVRLDNSYGPTEATITSSAHPTVAEDAQASHVPIGKGWPLRPSRALTLDGARAPLGAVAELGIGGALLARGYLGRPALTAERFVPDPEGEPGARLYRTGDLCRLRPDGELEFLGRTDQQIKLRGYRIELGEVEAALRSLRGVHDVAATVRGMGEARHLLGYVTAQPGSMLDGAMLLHELEAQLPDHLLPVAILVLPELPRTPNGKLDRRALPDWAPAALGREPVAPRTPLERQLLGLFERVLGHANFGVRDDFFDLGGDSLSALRLAALARREGVVGFSLEALLARGDVASLAVYLDTLAAKLPSNVLPLNDTKAELTLFCIHPLYGTIAAYRELARSLRGVAQVYGLQSPLYSEPGFRVASFAELAREYAVRIRKVQPSGPYCILGWSLGGWLATSIAAHLEAQGESLAFVGLVDCAAKIEASATSRAELERELRASVDAAAAETYGEVLEELGAARRTTGEQATLFDTLLDVIVQHEELLTTHRLPRLAADMHLWWATSAHGPAPAEQRDWQRYTAGRVSSEELRSTHAGSVHDAGLFESLRRVLLQRGAS